MQKRRSIAGSKKQHEAGASHHIELAENALRMAKQAKGCRNRISFAVQALQDAAVAQDNAGSANSSTKKNTAGNLLTEAEAMILDCAKDTKAAKGGARSLFSFLSPSSVSGARPRRRR